MNWTAAIYLTGAYIQLLFARTIELPAHHLGICCGARHHN